MYRSNGRYRNDGKMSESRVAWVQTAIGTFEIRQHAPGDVEGETEGADLEGQIGANLRLGITRPGMYKPASFNFTALTLPELTALRTIINLAFDLAEPVVVKRDEVAQRAKENGDDSYARVYRALPKLVVREGKIIQHGEGVQHGPEDVPSGSGSGPVQPVGLGGRRAGGTGDGVATEESPDSGTEDNGATPDES